MSTSIEERGAVSVWFTAPRTIELRASSVRAPEREEVRVKALFSGISHGGETNVYRGEVPAGTALDSTLPTLQGSFSYPLKYGYANVGRVVDVGEAVTGLAEGDLVFAFNPHETCYTVPASVLVKLPKDLEPRIGVFTANLETAVNALLDAVARLGERVVVIGQGVVGLLISRLIRKSGASLIITSDLYEKRRALSLSAGADLAIDPAKQDLSQCVLAAT